MKPNVPSVAFWKQAFKEHGAKCVYCPEERKVAFTGTLDDYIASSIDHLIPTSEEGENHPDNIVPSCLSCNFYKSNFMVEKPELGNLTEYRGKYLYVRKDSVARYVELMKPIIQKQKDKKKAEFEEFKQYVENKTP